MEASQILNPKNPNSEKFQKLMFFQNIRNQLFFRPDFSWCVLQRSCDIEIYEDSKMLSLQVLRALFTYSIHFHHIYV